MKKPVLIAALWALSLVAAYVVASRQSASEQTAGLEKSSETSFKPSPNLRRSGQPAKPVKRANADKRPARIIEKVIEYRTVAEEASFGSRDISELLPKALGSKDVLGRNLEIAQMLANLNAGNIDAALEAFEETSSSNRNDDYFRMFMYAWGQIGGKDAVEYAFFNEDAKKVSWGGTTAMTAWAEADPAAALEYLNSVDDEFGSKRFMLQGLIGGWAKTDLAGASAYVAGIENEGERNRHIDTLARQYMEQQGADGAFRWAELVASQNEDGSYVGSIFDNVTQRIARDDPQSAADFIDRNIDSEFISKRAFGEVVDELAERDPIAAARWLVGHWDHERVDGDVVAELANEWAKTDPVGAANWIDQFIGTDRVNTRVVDVTVREWARNPAKAIDWINGMDNPDLQRRGYASSMDQWARNDPNAAGEWLNSIQRTEVHDQAIESYTRRIMGDAPMVALTWARQIQNDQLRERNTIRTAQSMYRSDPEAINEWLPGSGLSEAAQQMVKNPPRQWRGRGGRGGRGR